MFDGNGYVIDNLFISRGSHTRAGLFDGTAWGSVVRDLGLPGADVTGNDGVGALAGVNNGTVLRSWSTGSVTGNAGNVGGLVGYNGNGDLIAYSWSSATVTGGGNSVGGLAGRNGGTIRGGYATGAVSGGSGLNIGGLAGLNEGGSVLRSYAKGAVSGDGQRLGGLVGQNNNSGSITASYATGSVTLRGGDTGGGLVGWNNNGSISNSYATGAVSAPTGTASVGGLVGSNTAGGTVTASYWDTTTSGQSGSGGGTGQTTAELQAPANAGIYSAWDADNWDFGTEQEYPALKADHDGDGRATWQEFGLQWEPGPVTDLAAARAANDDIVVTWGAPEGPGSGVFEKYQYRVSEDGGTNWGNWMDTSDTSHTFTPTADTGYTVAARAFNLVPPFNQSSSTRGRPNAGAASRIGPPAAPTDLTLFVYQAHPTGPDRASIGVQWRPPTNVEGITGYVVQFRQQGSTGPWSDAATCSDPQYLHQAECESGLETWTVGGPWREAGGGLLEATTGLLMQDTPTTCGWRRPTPWASANSLPLWPRPALRRARPACRATCGSCPGSAS